MSRILVLGGTTEGRRLAEHFSDMPGFDVIVSLAGRTQYPVPLPGEVRIGGFGGVGGLAEFLAGRQIAAVVDATHPFASTMTENVVAATARARVPLLVLRRPGWAEGPGDNWVRVPTLHEAAATTARLGTRVFLTTGRQGLGAFAGVDSCWFLARSVEPPSPPMPARIEVILDRGPFTHESELLLLRAHEIDVVVTKDSGGHAPKLQAARELGLPVIMVDRPPVPASGSVSTVEEATAWLLKVARR